MGLLHGRLQLDDLDPTPRAHLTDSHDGLRRFTALITRARQGGDHTAAASA